MHHDGSALVLFVLLALCLDLPFGRLLLPKQIGTALLRLGLGLRIVLLRFRGRLWPRDGRLRDDALWVEVAAMASAPRLQLGRHGAHSRFEPPKTSEKLSHMAKESSPFSSSHILL